MNCLRGVRALQRADHEADALSSGWRGCRRCTDINEREVLASRRGRAIERDRLVNGSTCRCCDGSAPVNCGVSEPHSEGRSGDRERLACSESAWHFVRRRAERLFVIERCCRPCPGASFDQRFTSGDVKGMPCGISEVIAEYRRAKPSSSAQSALSHRAQSSRVNPDGRPQQASTRTTAGT
jgi:hypothetical protein